MVSEFQMFGAAKRYLRYGRGVFLGRKSKENGV